MKKLRRFLCLIVAVCIAASVFAGCSGNKEKDSSAEAQTTQQVTEATATSEPNPFEKRIEISIGYWDSAAAFDSRANDPMLQKIEKDFNVKLVSKSPTWNDFGDKYKLWAASGELPDIFAHDIANTEMYYTWIKQGIIRALPEDLSKYPNVQKQFEKPDVKALKTEDGKNFMLPRPTGLTVDQTCTTTGFVVRKDWMQKLGIQTPKTFDDYAAMLKAFKENDPDGNGQDDQIGLTMRGTWFIQHWFLGMGSPAFGVWAWLEQDGQWIPPYMDKNMLDGIKKLRKLYQDGLIDKDFSIEKLDEGTQKFYQGKSGLCATQTDPERMKVMIEEWKKFNPDKDFFDCVGLLPIWANDDGKYYRWNSASFWSHTYFNSNVDDEKMDRILRIYDYLFSEEWQNIIYYGIEGVDYKKEGDKIIITRAKDDKGNYEDLEKKYPSLKLLKNLAQWSSLLTQGINEHTIAYYGESSMKAYTEFYNWYTQNAEIAPVNWDVHFMYTPAKTEAASIWPVDDIIKIMIDKKADPEKDWNKTAEAWKQKSLEKAIKEVNEKAAQLGIN